MEIVLAAYEQFTRRNAEELVGLVEEDFLLDMTERVFNPDTYRGREGIRRFVKDVSDAWKSYVWTVEETLVAGDKVVAMVHCEGRGRGGARVEWRVAWLWEFQSGRPASARFYRQREEALEAAGLSG